MTIPKSNSTPSKKPKKDYPPLKTRSAAAAAGGLPTYAAVVAGIAIRPVNRALGGASSVDRASSTSTSLNRKKQGVLNITNVARNRIPVGRPPKEKAAKNPASSSDSSFESLHTVDGVCHNTYRAAALALHLQDDDQGWHACMKEATLFNFGSELRSLFAAILVYCSPSDPRKLWKAFKEHLSQDY